MSSNGTSSAQEQLPTTERSAADAFSHLPNLSAYDYAVYEAGLSNNYITEWNVDSAFIPTCVVYGVIFVVGTVANLMVIATRVATAMHRTSASYFLVSLSVADVIYLLVWMPYELAVKMETSWVGGSFLCKTATFAEMLTTCAAIFNLTAVSVERYLVIVHPIKSRSWCDNANTNKTIFVLWVLAAMVSAPLIFITSTKSHLYYNWSTYEVVFTCTDDELEGKRSLFAWFQLMVMFFLPLLIIIFCYALVIRVLWLSNSELQRLTQPQNRSGSFAQRTSSNSQSKTSANFHSVKITEISNCVGMKETRKQVIKMLLLIILVFFFCSGPKWVLNVLKKSEADITHFNSSYIIMLTIHMLPYLQCSINPIIYGVMSKSFRMALKAAFTRICGPCQTRCCKKQPHFNGTNLDISGFEHTPSTHVLNVRPSIYRNKNVGNAPICE